jgi:hypothetical protein
MTHLSPRLLMATGVHVAAQLTKLMSSMHTHILRLQNATPSYASALQSTQLQLQTRASVLLVDPGHWRGQAVGPLMLRCEAIDLLFFAPSPLPANSSVNRPSPRAAARSAHPESAILGQGAQMKFVGMAYGGSGSWNGRPAAQAVHAGGDSGTTSEHKGKKRCERRVACVVCGMLCRVRGPSWSWLPANAQVASWSVTR